MKKSLIVSAVISVLLFGSSSVMAAAQPDLKQALGNAILALSGTFTFVEYDNDANFVMTLKTGKVATKDKKVRKLLRNKEIVIAVSKDTPTMCKEDKTDIGFAMFGYGDRFEVQVSVQENGKLRASKIRSLSFHCDPSQNKFPKNAKEGGSKGGLYHGTIKNIDYDKGTFDLFVIDKPYKVTVKKNVSVLLQNSPDLVFFVPKGKFKDVKENDNGYVFGYFKNNNLKGTQIRIDKPLPY